MNPAQHISQAVKYQKHVIFTGTASTTYKRGTGVAYNRDYGDTPTDAEGRRDKYVEPLTTSNNMRFAGVLDRDVVLTDLTTEGVVINEPGSVCDIAVGSNTVINSTILNCLAGGGSPGRFRADFGTRLGRGAALALQTKTAAILGETITAGDAAVATATVTCTGLFADAAIGDKLVILASAVAANGNAGATRATYTISSVTDDDNAVLTASPGDGALAGYLYSGNPTVLAYLFDGKETGCIEWINVINGTASPSMAGGMTHIFGGYTLAANGTHTLADGTFPGQRKGFHIRPNGLSTSDYVVTVTSGVQLDGSTALATMTFDVSLDYSLLEWDNLNWKLIANSGTALA